MWKLWFSEVVGSRRRFVRLIFGDGVLGDMRSAGGSSDQIELELGLVLFLCLDTFFLWQLLVVGVVRLGS